MNETNFELIEIEELEEKTAPSASAVLLRRRLEMKELYGVIWI